LECVDWALSRGLNSSFQMAYCLILLSKGLMGMKKPRLGRGFCDRYCSISSVAIGRG
jgi:hypothetical protein